MKLKMSTWKIRTAKTIGFILGMVLIQQGVSWLGGHFSPYREQQEIILRHGMDPSVFFYTESEQALKAEKQVRKKVRKID